MELTLVLSVDHFWMGFQPFQNMQNCPPSAKRAVWEVQKIPSVVQRVKYWYDQLGRVFGMVNDVPEAHWGTFRLFSQ